MAISMAATATCSLNRDHSAIASTPNSIPFSTKVSKLSFLRFPRELRPVRFVNQGFKSESKSRSRTLLVEAKKQTFSSLDEMLEKSDKPILVDFYATWCGPCQFMTPILNEVSATLKDKIQVVKIDTEKYPSIADKYKIEALPTFILFKDGKPSDRFEGAMTASNLIQRIEASLSVKQ